MILRYEHLAQAPNVFKVISGMPVTAFDELVGDVKPIMDENEQIRRSRPTRRRAIGGGHPYELSPPDQILLTIIWLRHRPTHEVLAYMFGVSKPTATRVIARIMPLLESPRSAGGSTTPAGVIAEAWRRSQRTSRC
jgi:hypothetical protein